MLLKRMSGPGVVIQNGSDACFLSLVSSHPITRFSQAVWVEFFLGLCVWVCMFSKTLCAICTQDAHEKTFLFSHSPRFSSDIVVTPLLYLLKRFPPPCLLSYLCPHSHPFPCTSSLGQSTRWNYLKGMNNVKFSIVLLVWRYNDKEITWWGTATNNSCNLQLIIFRYIRKKRKMFIFISDGDVFRWVIIILDKKKPPIFTLIMKH